MREGGRLAMRSVHEILWMDAIMNEQLSGRLA
jgi:hypothetical protein